MTAEPEEVWATPRFWRLAFVASRLVKRFLVVCVALPGFLLADCGGGGPSQAESSACAPFAHFAVPTTSVGHGSSVSMSTKWVTQLLHSGNTQLVEAAKTIEQSGSALNVLDAVRSIVSECRAVGA
jgi:hypothetical protein